jgi:hypothetical protein
MSTRIEIQGNLVSVIESSVLYAIPLEDWMPQIEARKAITVPVLPTGTRSVWWDPTITTQQKLGVLIEQQPQIINMSLQGTIKRLSLPWVRWVFYCETGNPQDNLSWTLRDYRVFFSKNKFTDRTTRDMIPALLPNVYEDGRICFGSTGADANQTISDRLDQTTAEFWASEFNRDLNIRRPMGASSYRRWERMTTNDPTGWMQWADLDVDAGYWSFYSFDGIISSLANHDTGRFDPMFSPDEIPYIPLNASFGRAAEWLNGLDRVQRERLRRAIAQIDDGPVVIPDPDTDDEDDDDE